MVKNSLEEFWSKEQPEGLWNRFPGDEITQFKEV